jgi:hypothetical protein
MDELREWIRAAEAARVTCLNVAEFDVLIRHQKQRLEERVKMEKVRVRRAGEKFIYIHNNLSAAALYFKGVVEKKVEAKTRDAISFDCMACLIVLAFTFEAYINFLGDRLIDGWKEREPFDDKVEKVFDHLKVTLNKSARPCSSIALLKRFRDTLAHGKPSKKKSEEIVMAKADELDRHIDLSGDWEKDCNENAGLQAYEDVEAMWRELLEKSGLSVFDTMTQGTGTTTVIEPITNA